MISYLINVYTRLIDNSVNSVQIHLLSDSYAFAKSGRIFTNNFK